MRLIRMIILTHLRRFLLAVLASIVRVVIVIVRLLLALGVVVLLRTGSLSIHRVRAFCASSYSD